MPACCYGDEYGSVFPEAEAAAHARRFRRRGLTGTSATLVALLEDEGIVGAEVLEVGAGAGEVLVTLLERGAHRAFDVDLSPGWARAAAALVEEYGHAARFEARAGDFVDLADDLPEVDVVVLNRVVCCYPDPQAMLRAAADGTRSTVALVFPTERAWTRAGVAVANLYVRLRGFRFRVFVHPEAAILDALAAHGLVVASERRGAIWRTVVARKS